MKIAEERLDFIPLKNDLLVMLWDRAQGWKPVSSNCNLAAGIDSASMGLDALKNLVAVPISVNLSRRHLKNQNFIKVLDGLIDKYQIPRKYLEIEITETVEDNEINQGVLC